MGKPFPVAKKQPTRWPLAPLRILPISPRGRPSAPPSSGRPKGEELAIEEIV